MKLGNLGQRVITGFLFVLVMITGIYFGPYPTYLMFAIAALVSLHEFYALARAFSKPIYIGGFTIAILGFLSFLMVQEELIPPHFLVVNILSFLAVILSSIYIETKRPFTNLSVTIFGVIYTVLPFIFLLLLGYDKDYEDSYRYDLILGLIFMIWISDTFAFFVGSRFGKIKIAPKISPGKSLEGLVGGFAGVVALAFIQHEVFETVDFGHWLVIGVLVMVFGVQGDLLESRLKRSVNAKESGSLLPGHGGFLDRFDSVYLSAPAVFVYCKLANIL